MYFLPVYLGFLITFLSVTSAGDIPVSVGDKESNVTSFTSVILLPSQPTQHLKQERKEASETLSGQPISTEFHQMDRPSKLLESIQADYEKLKKEVEERKATHSKARKEFDLKKEEDEKELAKMDGIIEQRKVMEEKLKKETEQLDKMKARLSDENKVEDLPRGKEEVEKKILELDSLSEELAKELIYFKDQQLRCVEVPSDILESWQREVPADIRMCIKTS